MIRESKIHQIDNVIATSQKEGMIAMDTSLIQMYQKGIISKEDAIARGKEALGNKLNGTIVKEIYVPKKIVNIVQK